MTETTGITSALARAVQALRAERGWSLDQLAARSGVSKGVLVAVEQARSNPNLATLARISDAFGVPVTRLLDVTDGQEVRITDPGQARVLWRGPPAGPAPSSRRPSRRGLPNCGAGRSSRARHSAVTRTQLPPGRWPGSRRAH